MTNFAISRALGLSIAAALAATALPYGAAAAATTPATLSLKATSHDGTAFDLDEYAAGDVTVQVTSSATGAVDVDDIQDLTYFWTVKPFGASTTAVRVPASGTDTETTDVNGEFVVPLPVGQGPGTYALTAGLGPDAASAHAISSATLLTVKTGNAVLSFADAAPLRTAAGADRTVAGSLRLEDGTGLSGRLIDLGLQRGAAGTDPEADAGFVPVAPATAPVTASQVSTVAGGAFSTVLSDPAEDGQGTELGGTIDADTASTPDIGDAGAGSTLPVDLVSLTAPSGTTAVLDDLGDGTPGQALAGKLTVTAPDDTFDVDAATPGVQGDADTDRDPVEGQVYSLKVDHGFFTTGQGSLPSVVGAEAGDLVSLGKTRTGLTGADGTVDFAVGIARDPGFDDDGLVSATVDVDAGGPSSSTSAAWDSSHPLNGHVALALSPAGEQVAPVNPALAGNRTYYEVFGLDQFGNRLAGAPVDLTYSGDLDDWDYSDDFVVSDLDLFGDIWIDSFEAGAIKVTGTWADAPTYRYADTAGTAVAGTADATGAATASFYQLSFKDSRFSIRSTATDVVKVGTPVSQTVRVLDQKGNPVRGYQVRFFRYGPDKTSGDAVATKSTNALGEATYTFVGNKVGRATVTAEVTDGASTRYLTSRVVFGTAITARLTAGKGGPGADRLSVSAAAVAAGARVQLYRVVRGKQYLAGTATLNRLGKASFRVRDRNRRSVTTYVAVVRSTPRSVADLSNAARIR